MPFRQFDPDDYATTMFPEQCLQSSNKHLKSIQKKREILIQLTRILFIKTYACTHSSHSATRTTYILIDSNRLFASDSRHCVKLTPAKARMYPHIWDEGCQGICQKIVGYEEFVREGKKSEADNIYASASACKFNTFQTKKNNHWNDQARTRWYHVSLLTTTCRLVFILFVCCFLMLVDCVVLFSLSRFTSITITGAHVRIFWHYFSFGLLLGRSTSTVEKRRCDTADHEQCPCTAISRQIRIDSYAAQKLQG